MSSKFVQSFEILVKISYKYEGARSIRKDCSIQVSGKVKLKSLAGDIARGSSYWPNYTFDLPLSLY